MIHRVYYIRVNIQEIQMVSWDPLTLLKVTPYFQAFEATLCARYVLGLQLPMWWAWNLRSLYGKASHSLKLGI